MPETSTPDNPELVENEAPERALRRQPTVPVTLSELAALQGDAAGVVEARVQVIETLRKAAIRMTSPEDWLLFKSPDDQGGQVVGYLQDCGCDRVRDLWGIEIYDVSRPEKVMTNDPKVFHYLIFGSGRCKLTKQIVEEIEGGRSSTDDFCKDKIGIDLELAVRKAARANLDGNITRELSGMKSVPVDELTAAWLNTAKKVENCRRGRGFGTRNERLGANKESAPDVEPPVCPHCNAKGVYRPAKGDRKAFYGCPNYEKHPTKKFIVDAAKWVADQQGKTPAPQTASAAEPAKASGPAPTASELFGRDPGQEG